MADTRSPVLSVLMPVYNERRTVVDSIGRLERCDFGVPFELVVVDDGSTDGSRDLIADLASGHAWIKPVYHDRNGGKGAAIKTALGHASGRFSCIYDADLEYDPSDMAGLLEPLLKGQAEVSYGVRSFGAHTAHSYWYVVGNRAVSLFQNVLFNRYIQDMMTCFKMLPTDLFRSLDIRSNSFDLEAEITGKLAKAGYRIYEVPITYTARGHDEGKKLRSSHAWGVLIVLLKIRFGLLPTRARPPAPGIPNHVAGNGHTSTHAHG